MNEFSRAVRSRLKPKKAALRNGWVYVSDKVPDEGEAVLVTNNPDARDAFGRMSHIWLGTIFRAGRRKYDAWVSDSSPLGMKRVYDIVAWHSLPAAP